MVTLIVATTYDPASINPAKALLAMPGWTTGPTLPPNIKSFTNQQTRLIQHDVSIVKEDDLDSRWEEATGEVVDEVIFLSRHTAASNRPALTVHPIGVLHLKEGESPPHGGKAGWAALPSPRIGPWLRLLKKMAEAHSLVPEFEITLEGTHHGPITNKPTMFLEIGENLLLIWEGLGLGGGEAVGSWNSETGKRKVLLGIGGGHYAPRHVDVVLKDDIWVGHLLSGYSLPMEEAKPGENHIGGTWRQSIQAAFEATKASFPGGEILAHLDQKSFKGWQKKAITDNVYELFYDTRSGDEWDKDNNGDHSCGDSNETGKKLNSHDIVDTRDPIEKVDPEKTYHVVKDICADEGVLVQEKSVTCNSNSNSNLCESEDLVKSNALETESFENRKDEVATSENVLKEYLTLEDVLLRKSPPQLIWEGLGLGGVDAVGNWNSETRKRKVLLGIGGGHMDVVFLINALKRSGKMQRKIAMCEKGKRSLDTTALKTELEETEDPEKAEKKFSSVSTKTSQGLFRETSFSAAEPVSGHITYSGPIVFSGSLSVRSDASTTSGRSFAFPVLQSEWNSSSPVRMAKANKKRQKGWGDILMCCRFS
ncbi:hypothetical protein HID58_007174 [Brassica napus]|uniref:D-aminoacyl-tRNA deacylase n=1 Tax=Brassica napus TaxID=3708 RepID=A0ABQ8EG26_BRANA|nr:hypothetical protein HID58_007174 [Brassica napus]